MIDKPQANPEASKSGQKQADESPITSTTLNRTPARPSKSQETSPPKKREYSQYIVWPVITIWRGIKATIVFLDTHDGAITAIATVAIGFLTWFYVGYSQKQWQIARDTLSISQRSYVTIGRKDGTVAEFVTPKDVKQNAQLILYFQNSGHVPAKLAWGTYPMELLGSDIKASGMNYTHPFKGMARTRAKDGSVGWKGESTTIAGDSVFRAVLGEISQDRIGELSVKNANFAIFGFFQYCDELGTDATHQFTISYENAPDNSLYFRLLVDADFPSPPPVSTKDVQYLPPCETLEEKSSKK